jgi:hypothetical protein
MLRVQQQPQPRLLLLVLFVHWSLWLFLPPLTLLANCKPFSEEIEVIISI